MKLLHALAVSALLAGCSPNFQSITVPPPTKKAELDDEDRTIEISKGVALAFECTNQGVPCASASAKVDDAKIATVMSSYVDVLSPALPGDSGRTKGAKPRTVFVVLGVAAGYDDAHRVVRRRGRRLRRHRRGVTARLRRGPS